MLCQLLSLSTKLSVVVLILESKVQREAVGIVFNFTAVGQKNIVLWQRTSTPNEIFEGF